jgi:hypothetical protein
VPAGKAVILTGGEGTVTVIHAPEELPVTTGLCVIVNQDGTINSTPLSEAALQSIHELVSTGHSDPQSGVVGYHNLGAMSPYSELCCNHLRRTLLASGSYAVSSEMNVSDAELEKEDEYMRTQMGDAAYAELQSRVDQAVRRDTAVRGDLPLFSPLPHPLLIPPSTSSTTTAAATTKPIIATHEPTRKLVQSLPPGCITKLVLDDTFVPYLFHHYLNSRANEGTTSATTATTATTTTAVEYILHTLTLHVVLLVTSSHHPSLNIVGALLHNIASYLTTMRRLGNNLAAPPSGIAIVPKLFFEEVVSALPAVLEIVGPYKDIPEVESDYVEDIEEFVKFYSGSKSKHFVEVIDDMNIDNGGNVSNGNNSINGEDEEDEMLLLLEQLELPALKLEYMKCNKSEDIMMVCRRVLDEGSNELKDDATAFLGFYGVEINGEL